MSEKHIEKSVDEILAYVDSLEVEQSKEAVAITEETKLSVLWAKIRPFTPMFLMLVPKKIRLYLKALIGAIDTIVANEDENGEEEE